MSGVPSRDGKADHFTLKADTSSAVTITYPLRNRARLDQNINIKANQINEAVNVKAYGPIGDVEANCENTSPCVPTLVIKIVDKIALPPENTEAGIVARLLLAESVSPADGENYGDGTTVLQTMSLMRVVLENRVKAAQKSQGLRSYVACNPATDNFRGVIFAHKCGKSELIQFAGFKTNGQIDSVVVNRINDILKFANTGTHSDFSLYRKHVEEAIKIASGPNLSSAPISSSSLLYWRTTERASPTPVANFHSTQGGQDFYTLPEGYLKDPNTYKP